MQGKDLVLIGALGGLGYIVYKWWENTQSTAPVGTQTTTNATGQTIATSTVGGGTAPGITTPAQCPHTAAGCVVTSTGVVLHVPTMARRPVILPPSILPATSPYADAFTNTPGSAAPGYSFAHGAFGTGVTGRQSLHGLYGLGHISPSIGFGIRRAANIFPLGIERRIIY